MTKPTKSQLAQTLADAARAVAEISPRKHALKQQMLEIRIERLAEALKAYEDTAPEQGEPATLAEALNNLLENSAVITPPQDPGAFVELQIVKRFYEQAYKALADYEAVGQSTKHYVRAAAEGWKPGLANWLGEYAESIWALAANAEDRRDAQRMQDCAKALLAAQPPQPEAKPAPEQKKGTDGKEVCYFITEHDFCSNPMLNSERSALQWFEAFLENLDDGDTSEVTVKRQDMTEAEIEKIPEV